MKRWRLAVLALAVLGAAGHVAFWYLPRERSGVPELERVRALVDDPRWDVTLWIPYPHQNFGVLEDRVGDADAWLAGLAEAAGRQPLVLPKFGPWSAPPAREMAIAAEEGGGLVAVARVYPTVAALARLAGRLAGNPWLAGGAVPLGRRGTGRVRWEGRVWVLESDRPAPLGGPAAGAEFDHEPALAQLRLRRPPPPLPAGLWTVRRDVAGELVATLGRPDEPMNAGPVAPGGEPPAAWVARAEGASVSALFLWTAGGPIEGFPRAATLDSPGARGFEIPGAPLARLAGIDPAERAARGFVVRAFDTSSLEEGARIAPWLEETLGGAAGAHRRVFAAGADPGRAADALRRGSEHLARIPVFGARESRRLGAAAGLLAPWGGCSDLRIEVWEDPPGARALLCGSPGPVPPR